MATRADDTETSRRPMSVAERKRRQRARLHEAGLVPVEVWIPEKHRRLLRRIEKLLRLGITPDLPKLDSPIANGDGAMDIKLLRETLDDFTSENGFRFRTGEIDGSDAVEVIVEDRDEFPIIVSADGEQTLCLTYLWDDSQVKSDKRTDLLTALLEMNVPLPLSSFGKIGDRYVLFGALAAGSQTEELITELETLSDNTLEVLEAVTPYLN
jgi:uncharacterized protein YjfI (DUF2170 family)